MVEALGERTVDEELLVVPKDCLLHSELHVAFVLLHRMTRHATAPGHVAKGIEVADRHIGFAPNRLEGGKPGIDCDYEIEGACGVHRLEMLGVEVDRTDKRTGSHG